MLAELMLAAELSHHLDNGEVAAKVFEPFFTTKGVGKETGLGLSQVSGMAQQSGGAVFIDSRQGSGTVIEIWLRVAMPAPSQGTKTGAEVPTLIGLKVLVVEDDFAVRAGMVDALLTLGCDVSQACNGKEALVALSSRAPGLLLTDYLMPGMTGVELATRARELYPLLPVLVATGYADMEAIENSVGSGAVLRKPFSLAQLSAAVVLAAGFISFY